MSTRHFNNIYNDGEIDATELDKVGISKKAFDLILSCTHKFPPVHDNHDGGLYVGFLGQAYALLHMSKTQILCEQRLQMLNLAKHLVEQDLLLYTHFKNMTDENKLSFLLGRLGSLAVASCVYDQLGMVEDAVKQVKQFVQLGERFLPTQIFKSGSDELFVGRAGYLAAVVMMRGFCRESTVQFPKELLYGILDCVVQSGTQYSHKHNSRSPLMYAYYGTEYLGAGHGLAGILLQLMQFKDYLEDRSTVVAMIQESLTYLLSVSTSLGPDNGVAGNLPPATEDIGHRCSVDSQLVHWCHGAAGALYVYARAYVLWKNDSFLQAALKCGDVVWKYGLLKKGPGICHGVAGSGYVFLVLYRLTEDPRHLHRARCFHEFLSSAEFRGGARVPDAPYSLFEGWAGTACFLADLSSPHTAAFPFSDVFSP